MTCTNWRQWRTSLAPPLRASPHSNSASTVLQLSMEQSAEQPAHLRLPGSLQPPICACTALTSALCVQASTQVLPSSNFRMENCSRPAEVELPLTSLPHSATGLSRNQIPSTLL